jgi:putative intracellular protease/amidase
MKILMVLTSDNQLGHTSGPTGFWLKEFAAPDFVFKGAGIELTLASPKGAASAPIRKTICLKIKHRRWRGSRRTLCKRLTDVKADDFDTVFYPGGTAR